jgi:hypothetical protein
VSSKRNAENGQDTVEEHIAPAGDDQRIDQAAARVRLRYKGLRVKVTGIPSRRAVNDTQKAEAADQFGAEADSVSMSSLLWNAKEDAVKDLRSVIAAISRTFHSRDMTLPTVTDGLRMIRKDCIGELDRTLRRLKVELEAKAAQLKEELPQIIDRERARRGRLFNVEDYNFDPTLAVDVKWWFPSVTEDKDLAELDDSVYQNEVARVRSEMRGVVQKAEEQMAEELFKMLDAIVERLTGTEEEGKRAGKPKLFKDNTVAKLFEELEYMSTQLKDNGIGGTALTQAAARIGQVLKGHSADTLPDALRKNEAYRDHVREKCAKIADELLKQAVPEKRRRIIRKVQ